MHLCLNLQGYTCQAVDLVTSATNLTCPHECEPGSECRFGVCRLVQCTQNCSTVPTQRLCGSNGVTYNNMCELEKARCELRQNIEKLYNGICKLI